MKCVFFKQKKNSIKRRILEQNYRIRQRFQRIRNVNSDGNVNPDSIHKGTI